MATFKRNNDWCIDYCAYGRRYYEKLWKYLKKKKKTVIVILALISAFFGTAIITLENSERWGKINYVNPRYKNLENILKRIRNKEKIQKNVPGFSVLVDIVNNRYNKFEKDIVEIEQHFKLPEKAGIPVLEYIFLKYDDGETDSVITPHLDNWIRDYQRNQSIKFGIKFIFLGFILNIIAEFVKNGNIPKKQ